MSLSAMSWCSDQNDLPPGEWVVLFHLCNCHNDETGRCDPSQTYLSERTNMGERTVRRHLLSLEKRGKITRRKRGIDGGGRLSDSFILGHEPAKLAANVSGQSMPTNRPNRAENVHEMAGKTGRNRKETGTTICTREKLGSRGVDPCTEKDLLGNADPPEARLPKDWVPNSQDRAFAFTLNLTDADIEEIADDFREYWTGSKGRRTKRTERGWHQAWKNRCRTVAPTFTRNRRMVGQTFSGRHGQGGSIASVVARRKIERQNRG